MRQKTPTITLITLAVSLLLVVFFAVPALAASEKSTAVLNQLSTLQNADISPDWLPDIRSQEHAVQTLMDLYKECSANERAEFTSQQNKTLRAYFEALYTVQGKDLAGIDEIFKGKEPAGSSSSSKSTQSSTASSKPASSASSSSASSKPASSASSSSASSKPASSASSSSASSKPASSASSSALLSSSAISEAQSTVASSLAQSETGGTSAGSDASSVAGGLLPLEPTNPDYPPQIPKGEGWTSILGNRGLASGLLILIFVCIFMMVIRFLAAMRAAGKVPVNDNATAMRAQELFGELYAMTDSAVSLAADGSVEVGKAAPPLKRAGRNKARRKSSKTQEANLQPEKEMTEKNPEISNDTSKSVEFERHAAQLFAHQQEKPSATNVPENPEVSEQGNEAENKQPPRTGLHKSAPPKAVMPKSKPAPSIVATSRPPPRTGRPAKMSVNPSAEEDVE